jgi:hypothetical protein
MLWRLRALDVVLGRSPRPESSKDRKEAKRAKAMRLAHAHVASESGILWIASSVLACEGDGYLSLKSHIFLIIYVLVSLSHLLSLLTHDLDD